MISGLSCLVSVGSSVSDNDELLFVHEFAHGFGGLADEYVDSSFAEGTKEISYISKALTGKSLTNELEVYDALGIIAPPNCKTSSNKGTWTRKGCGFSSSLYKPASNSIMSDHTLYKTFNQESKDRLELKLQEKIMILKSDSILKEI